MCLPRLCAGGGAGWNGAYHQRLSPWHCDQRPGIETLAEILRGCVSSSLLKLSCRARQCPYVVWIKLWRDPPAWNEDKCRKKPHRRGNFAVCRLSHSSKKAKSSRQRTLAFAAQSYRDLGARAGFCGMVWNAFEPYLQPDQRPATQRQPLHSRRRGPPWSRCGPALGVVTRWEPGTSPSDSAGSNGRLDEVGRRWSPLSG